MSSAEITKRVEKRLEAVNDELTDKASALMNMAYATGCAIAPIFGCQLADQFDFRTTADVMGFFALTCGIVFFILNYVPDLFCSADKEEEERNIDVSQVMTSRAWSISSSAFSMAGARQYRETLFDAKKEASRYMRTISFDVEETPMLKPKRINASTLLASSHK